MFLFHYKTTKTEPTIMHTKQQTPLKAAIIGRPNVGKSTLFNRLSYKKTSITKDYSGTTRDYLLVKGNIFDIDLDLFDTAGIVPDYALENQEKFFLQIQEQITEIIKSSDVVFFICDVKTGIINADIIFAKWLLKTCDKNKVLLIGNKSDNSNDAIIFQAEIFKLGFDTFLPISALHYIGFDNLYECLKTNFITNTNITKKIEQNAAVIDDPNKSDNDNNGSDKHIAVTLFGRPNVGKSSLLNILLNKKRVIVSDIAGTTIDVIKERIDWGGHTIDLIDTAGMRRSSKIKDDKNLEALSIVQAVKAMKQSDIVIMVLDASNLILEKQDLRIFSLIARSQKTPLIVLNKIDTLAGVAKQKLLKQINLICSKKMTQIPKVTSLLVSALTKYGTDKILKTAIALAKTGSKKISTPQLNKWLDRAVYDHSPPKDKGLDVRFKYAVQVDILPITIKIFANKNLTLPQSYIRYLTNNFSEEFQLSGVPIKLIFARSENPYHKAR